MKHLFTGILLGFNLFMAQAQSVDIEKSNLHWVAKKVTGEHFGDLKIKEGSLEIIEGKVKEGTFVIDMTSMTVTDMQGEWADKLLKHLKNDDFFSVEKFPESILEITDVKDMKAKGTLTIKGITKPIEFYFEMSEIEANEDRWKFTAKIIVNRTHYDIRYRSSSFFADLGDKAIYDNFEVEVVLLTKE